MIFEKLLEIFANVIPEVDTAEIKEDSKLIEDLGLNSLTMMLLAVSIEEEYDMKFDELSNLETVGEVRDYIADKTGLK